MAVNVRHSIRLKDYDYSWPGYYFITICVQDRKCLLGKVKEDNFYEGAKVHLSKIGEIIKNFTLLLKKDFDLDEWVIMPNHIHFIIGIEEFRESVGAIHELPLPEVKSDIKYRRNMALPKIIGKLKMNAAKEINKILNTSGNRFWQRNYYEHIIRSEKSLQRIRDYIINNPQRWQDDIENPKNYFNEEGAKQHYNFLFKA